MSFFNNLLSSIEKPGSTPNQVSTPRPSTPSSAPSRPNSALQNGSRPPPQDFGPGAATKRKASSSLDAEPTKKICGPESQQKSVQKPGVSPVAAAAAPAVSAQSQPTKLASSPPDPSTRFKPSNTTTTSKTAATTYQKQQMGPSRDIAASATPASSTPTTATSATSATIPPKRSSYKDLMARAQTIQASRQPVGQIKHKPVSKLSRREKARQAQREAEEKSAQARKAAPQTTNGERGSGPHHATTSSGSGERIKKRQPAEIGYKGTMRPGAVTGLKASQSQGGEGSMRSQNTGAHSSQASKYRNLDDLGNENRRYTYANYSDEDDGYDDDEGEDDDGSEGMEGGGFADLEEEEMLSLRAARNEDAREAREEEEHRKEKRRRLEALAKARASKKKY